LGLGKLGGWAVGWAFCLVSYRVRVGVREQSLWNECEFCFIARVGALGVDGSHDVSAVGRGSCFFVMM